MPRFVTIKKPACEYRMIQSEDAKETKICQCSLDAELFSRFSKVNLSIAEGVAIAMILS